MFLICSFFFITFSLVVVLRKFVLKKNCLHKFIKEAFFINSHCKKSFKLEDYASVNIFSYWFLGSNVFLQSYYGGDSHVIDDDSLGRRYEINDNAYALQAAGFKRNLNISIKKLHLYTFKKEEPFQNVSNNIFSLAIKIENHKSHRYYLQVMRIDCCWKLRVLFINQESTKFLCQATTFAFP